MAILTTTTGQGRLPRHFAAAFALVRRALRHGQLDFVLDDGRHFRINGAEAGPAAEIRIHHPDTFARLLREGDLGFCEAYLDGWWDTPDLPALLDLIFAGNDGLYTDFSGSTLLRAWENLRHWLRANSRGQARRNIAYHYDLGNEFYRLWLDETMTYSAALFRTGHESLATAQRQKYDQLLDRMAVQPGEHVLEIGCGWGGFAEHAARERGLRVTGLTISRAQYDYARARIAAAGLVDRVTIKLQDYRDETGRYDGIASIEMFEAVGEKYWPAYFATLRHCLDHGRNATLQIITIRDSRFEIYRRSVDFIQKYIFPGGMLPSPAALRAEVARAGLQWRDSVEFGDSYSQTLRRWYERFNRRWDEVQQMGFDDRFHRMWNFYLAACAGAFRGGNCDVAQITMSRP